MQHNGKSTSQKVKDNVLTGIAVVAALFVGLWMFGWVNVDLDFDKEEAKNDLKGIAQGVESAKETAQAAANTKTVEGRITERDGENFSMITTDEKKLAVVMTKATEVVDEEDSPFSQSSLEDGQEVQVVFRKKDGGNYAEKVTLKKELIEDVDTDASNKS